MSDLEPVYRKVCTVCQRPALTLDEHGDAFCSEHAVVFIGAEDKPDVDDDEDAV